MKHLSKKQSNSRLKLTKLIKRRAGLTISSLGLGLVALALSIMPTASQVASALTVSGLSATEGSIDGGDDVLVYGNGFTSDEHHITEGIKKMVAGKLTFILTDSGRLFIAGTNNNNMGLPEYSVIRQRTEITDLFSGRIVDVGSSGESAYVITDDGSLYVSGNNDRGQLGLGSDNVAIKDWTRINNLINNKKVKSMAVNSGSIILTDDGHVYAMGQSGQLPFASGEVMSNGKTYYGQNIYTPVDFTNKLNGDKPANVFTNTVVTDTGKILMWGKSVTGQDTPAWVEDRYGFDHGETLSTISTTLYNTTYIGLSNKGRIFTWGNNKNGQLGNGEVRDAYYEPVDITKDFGGAKIISVFAGSPLSYALTSDGRIYNWGTFEGAMAIDGQTKTVLTSPRPINNNGETYKMASLQGDTALLLTNDNQLMARGGNWYGSFGDGPTDKDEYDPDAPKQTSTTERNISQTLTGLSELNTIVNVKSVEFNGIAVNFAVLNAKTIKVTVPKSTKLGKVDVTVTDVNGQSTVLRNAYEYMENKASGDNKDDLPSGVTLTAPNTGYFR